MTDIREALDALVPESDEVADWEDVLRRAGVQRVRPANPKRARRGFAVTLVVAAAILVPVLVAAVLTRTNVIFSNSNPAPNIVKKQFLDLGLRAPPRFALEPLAAQAREVGTFRFGGHSHALWVAPTRRGGYCWMLEGAEAGCLATKAERRPIGASFVMTDSGDAVARIDGVVGDAARIEIRYADGSTADVPFVYVSRPIAAGFSVFEVPRAHQTKATRATEIVALDRNGRELGHQAFEYAPPRHAHLRPPHGARYVPPTLRPTPKIPPSEPAQRGAADGYSVVAGANGVVVFQAHEPSAFVERLLGQSAGYGCFKLVREFGIFDTKGVYFGGRFARSAVIRMFGSLPHPWDGCEIQGGYGHVWPDRNKSHSAVEIPFTEKGRRFFADRAAARDLSLFVRSRAMHRIRKETGRLLVDDLSRYPIVRGASPPVGTIGYALTAEGVTFVERSPTGKRFFVQVRNGRIHRSNVKPYAFVF
jgi:hypothetical protein